MLGLALFSQQGMWRLKEREKKRERETAEEGPKLTERKGERKHRLRLHMGPMAYEMS